jgi:hypothetical protein
VFVFFIFLYSFLSGGKENLPIIIVFPPVNIFIGRGSSGYKKLFLGSSMAECLGNNMEHDNKGAGKVNRVSPSGEMKTFEAVCTSLC